MGYAQSTPRYGFSFLIAGSGDLTGKQFFDKKN